MGYGNLGVLYRELGDVEQAQSYLTQAKRIDDEIGNLPGLATDFGNIGLLELKRGRLDLAEEALQKAVEIDRRIGRHEAVVQWTENLAQIRRQRSSATRN